MEHVDDWTQDGISTERAYEGEPIPSLSETITPRSLMVSLILGTTLSVVAMEVSLNSGILPSLSAPAGLLGFFFSHAWIRILDFFKVSHMPFTRQENTVVQTCIIACCAITYSGGFGTYILAMGKNAAGGDARDRSNIVEPSLRRLIPFLFLISFAGLVIVMPFKKVMIIRHQLTFPSGIATGHLINSFHNPSGASQARKQVKMFFGSFGGTIIWSFFQWFYTAGRGCGFETFPIFGLKAYALGYYFDFSMSNIGIGMICPHMITISMFVGNLLWWLVLCLSHTSNNGAWYAVNLKVDFLRDITSYKVFIGVAMMITDGLFNFLCILSRTLWVMSKPCKQPIQGCIDNKAQSSWSLSCTNREHVAKCFDDRRRAQVFMRDQIPNLVNICYYVLISIVSTIGIPFLYPQLRSYHIALIYISIPLCAFCNAYGMGITDINLASSYGKLTMGIFGSWVGLNNGGLIIELVACGVMVGAVSNGADLMQDLKTGYITLTSPHVVFVSKMIGTSLGCIISPMVFWIIYGCNTGNKNILEVPYAKVYRSIAMLTTGENVLAEDTKRVCWIFSVFALVLNVLREVAKRKQWRVVSCIPSTVGIAVAFFVPERIFIDMLVGCLLTFVWKRTNTNMAQMYLLALASGLICGDGLGSLMSSVLTLLHAQAPMCIKFLSHIDNMKLDGFLKTLPTL
ncbi:hypothetical protein EJB05_22087 [Eragrostis curvula]|uniref:Metal-nicotianamine transporter YSL7 n=1 Tax=Eragrostis curvula TaxID=38414 RepID=A0A5J9V2M6_9POAL|nr:hypothetical protein EJB05_22087 [Eragrostis curvula]